MDLYITQVNTFLLPKTPALFYNTLTLKSHKTY